MDANAGGIVRGTDEFDAGGFQCDNEFTKIAATRRRYPVSIFIANNCSDRDA